MHVQAPPVVPSSPQAELRGRHNFGPAELEGIGSDDDSGASSSEAISEEVISRLGSHASAGSRRQGSIASTYWRPERQDRKENLSVIDER